MRVPKRNDRGSIKSGGHKTRTHVTRSLKDNQGERICFVFRTGIFIPNLYIMRLSVIRGVLSILTTRKESEFVCPTPPTDEVKCVE